MEPALHFSVIRHAAWAPGLDHLEAWQAWASGLLDMAAEGEPGLSAMAPMLRRRAGRLDRLACEVGYQVMSDETGIPVVFCSRHGAAERSLALLNELTLGQPLSPTAFGMSVHNATSGLFSIARKDTANATALAGGSLSGVAGVVEACGLLQDRADHVLVIVADSLLPNAYRHFADEPDRAFAWAWLLGKASTDNHFSLHAEPIVTNNELLPDCPGSLAPHRFLLRQDAMLRQSDEYGNTWFWHRHA
ncbi:beta-ketoacyl synthase chain length factor [Chitinivorax sp. B]|uniref:beta-ketoacyl synthase chain length factor n=1 Tax=Chitinivorax sp. B TaxID=2502235 RepID=UPI0010F4DBBC|nr:beta-ketoacyl synthase chain length factor [Chitinivorax sp. B]